MTPMKSRFSDMVGVVDADVLQSSTCSFRAGEMKSIGFGKVITVSSDAGKFYAGGMVKKEKLRELLGWMPDDTVCVIAGKSIVTSEAIDLLGTPAFGELRCLVGEKDGIIIDRRKRRAGDEELVVDKALPVSVCAVRLGDFGKNGIRVVAAGKRADVAEPPIKPTRWNGRKIVGLASYPARESGMFAVVAALSPQCDDMRVALNEYEGEALDRVLKKLSAYSNVHARAYVGEEDLGCQNKFRAVDLCGADDYFLTVDDDLIYPNDYVETMIRNCDLFDGKAAMSCHGTKFLCPLKDVGMDTKPFQRAITVGENPSMFQADVIGCGTLCCRPSEIGLKFSVFDEAKNTGDDELLAVWASKRGIPMLVVPHRRRWIRLDPVMDKTTPLTPRDMGRKRLVALVNESCTEANARTAVDYHIIVPFYNDAKELMRCLESIDAQTMEKSRMAVTVVDDCSDSDQARVAEDACRRLEYVRYIKNGTRSMAGGARNTGLDNDPGSEYTVFVDSDDVFSSNDSMSRLDYVIQKNGHPDTVLCGFTFKASGKNRLFHAKSPAEMSTEHCVPPWTRVSKTSLVPRFKENRRMLNDVVHFLRHLDVVKTVCCTDFPFITYMNDNKESCWHSPSARLEHDAVFAQFAVVPDIMEEKFRHDYTAKRAIAQIQTEYLHTIKDTVSKILACGPSALMEER